MSRLGGYTDAERAVRTLELNPPALDAYAEGESPNIYHAGHLGFEASFDRVLIVEDPFKSGYECESCNQTGKIVCLDCEDGTSKLNPEIQCKSCHGSRKIDCSECHGKGEILVIPDNAKRRPTTGIIVSIGSEVKGYGLGDRVAFPNFCGEVWTLPGIDTDGNDATVVLRIIKEREVLCKMTGELSIRRLRDRASQISG